MSPVTQAEYPWICWTGVDGIYGDIRLPYAEALERISRIVAAAPDTVTLESRYFYGDGTPRDLIGHLLAEVGFVPAESKVELRARHGRTREFLENDRWMMSLYEEIFYGDMDTKMFLFHLQRHEDKGRTWADALKGALRNMASLERWRAQQEVYRLRGIERRARGEFLPGEIGYVRPD